MKPRFYHFIGFTMVLMTLMVFSAHAQEGMPNNEIPDLVIHPETNLHEEKPLLFEPEKSTSNSERTSQQAKEQSTIASKSTKSKGTETSRNTGAKTEDDALSFNFLYYIIQKFKISDIVEQ